MTLKSRQFDTYEELAARALMTRFFCFRSSSFSWTTSLLAAERMAARPRADYAVEGLSGGGPLETVSIHKASAFLDSGPCANQMWTPRPPPLRRRCQCNLKPIYRDYNFNLKTP